MRCNGSSARGGEGRSQDTSYAGSFFEKVVEGILERDRETLSCTEGLLLNCSHGVSASVSMWMTQPE